MNDVCGRYALYGPISRHRSTKIDDELPDWWDTLVDLINERPPRYNVAPTDRMPVVGVDREGGISMRELRWGLVPYWAKDIKIGYKAINARAEGIAEKPMFREAFKRRRCLVPARGYFEWKGEDKAKQPYFLHSPHAQLLNGRRPFVLIYTSRTLGAPGVYALSHSHRSTLALRMCNRAIAAGRSYQGRGPEDG